MTGHNLNAIRSTASFVDIGLNGGDAGGVIVAVGTPEKVAAVKESYTGQFLKPMLEGKE
jgi:excinuclease ABC subunit A